MAKDLPGFYFDREKNRYFPIKGPMPGQRTTSSLSTGSLQKPKPEDKCNIGGRKRKSAKLLQQRERDGKLLAARTWKRSFQLEYQKLKVSEPMVWKYQHEDNGFCSALERFHVDIQTPEGDREIDALLTGGLNGCISFYGIGGSSEDIDGRIRRVQQCIWPLVSEYAAVQNKTAVSIWAPTRGSLIYESAISCIQRSLMEGRLTTLGSGFSDGAIYILNLSEPLDLSQFLFRDRISRIASFNKTVWSADCSSDGAYAAVGMDQGAALVNLESRAVSWACRSKSDILSLKFVASGNILLCGFRNGAVVPIDVRQKPGSLSVASELPRHKIPLLKNKRGKFESRHHTNSTRGFFQLKGKVIPSGVIFMSSAVCSLVSLQSHDHHFLASSMDGTIKLYDHRLSHRGAVQSYEGHMNTHSHLQMGVDPSESFLMSGGEDGYLRIWSITSGEQLFNCQISDSVVSTVCWSGSGESEQLVGSRRKMLDLNSSDHIWDAWVGSGNDVYYVHGA